jgi:hypothetical protein
MLRVPSMSVPSRLSAVMTWRVMAMRSLLTDRRSYGSAGGRNKS